MENGSKFYMVKKKALPGNFIKSSGSKCSSKQRKGKNNQRGD